jgi:purine-binding chemotaxis protein CheW
VKGQRQRSPIAKAAPVDWAEVRRRLGAVQAVMERALNPSGEEKRRILKARAAALGRERGKQTEEESVEVVTFLLAYETYGLESRWVREIFPLRELTPLPWNPPFVAGIVNVRGRILPVVDIKKLFDLPEKGLTDLNKVLIIHSGDLELGILADQVLGMRSVPLSGIQSSLPTLMGIREDYLRGVTADRLVILDAVKILTDQRVAADSMDEK